MTYLLCARVLRVGSQVREDRERYHGCQIACRRLPVSPAAGILVERREPPTGVAAIITPERGVAPQGAARATHAARQADRIPESPRVDHAARTATMLWAIVCAPVHAQTSLPVETIRLPSGFSIEVVARVPNARAMTWGAAGTLFVGSRVGRQGLRADAAAAGREGRSGRRRHRVGIARACGRGLSRRRALRVGRLAHPALRRHRAPPRRPADAGGRQRPLPDRRSPWPQVHRLRSRRQAVRSGRCALQCLRARARPLRSHHANESRRQRCRGLRARPAQHGRFRLGPANEGTVVHRQRPRHARRRLAARHAEPRAACRTAVRLSVLPRRHAPGSGVRRSFARAANSVRRRRRSGRTSRRSACASTPARSFRRPIATASSSPSTARGTAAGRSATA